MTRLFPEARDYKTITRDISPSQLQAIESRIGTELLPGQRRSFQYFEMLDKEGAGIGYTIAASQKGEFGAIEFVFGLDNSFRIIGIYIQRSRERNNTFKEKAFLDLFINAGIPDSDSLEKLYRGSRSVGTDSVIQGIKKELAAFDELVLKVKQ